MVPCSHAAVVPWTKYCAAKIMAFHKAFPGAQSFSLSVSVCVRSSVFAVLEFVRHWCPPSTSWTRAWNPTNKVWKTNRFSTSTLPLFEVPRIKFQTMKPFFVCFPIGNCRVWIPKKACYLFAQAARQAQNVQQDLKAWPQRWDARPRIRRPVFFLVNTFRKWNIANWKTLRKWKFRGNDWNSSIIGLECHMV